MTTATRAALPDGQVLVIGSSGQTGVPARGGACTSPVGRCSWHVAARRGCRAGWTGSTSSPGWPGPRSSIRHWSSCLRPRHDSLRTSRRLEPAAVTICTTAPCSPLACRCSVALPASTATCRELAATTSATSVAFGDARYLDIRQLLRNTIGSAVPEMPDPPPFEAKAASEVDLDGFGAVVFTSGFRPDYGGWVKFPVFDQRRFPIVNDALATAVPGLYFCGVHFLRKRDARRYYSALAKMLQLLPAPSPRPSQLPPRLHETIRPTECNGFANTADEVIE